MLLLVYILCYTGVNDFITNITISVLQNLFISIYKFITETVSMAEIAQDLIYFATDIMDFAIFVLPNVINFFKGLIQSTESIYILLLLIIVVITCMVQTIKFIKQTKLKGLGILLFIFIILLAGAFVVFKIFGAIASVFILLFVWLGALVS